MSDGTDSGEHCVSSGIQAETPNGRKPITEVINIYEAAGDTARAALLRSIRAAVLEAGRAREAAKQYVIREGLASLGVQR